MTSVFSRTWRIPCSGLRASSNSPWATLVKRCNLSDSSPQAFRRSLRLMSLGPYSFRVIPSPVDLRSPLTNGTLFYSTRLTSPFLSRSVQTKRSSNSLPQQQQQRQKQEQAQSVEDGVSISSKPLSASKINLIFGSGKVSPAMGNRILMVLHSRRLRGTLDLGLPSDIARIVRPHTIDAALAWLRRNHPVDEEAAIRARVEREEREKDEEFLRRADESGLYKPQSGTYEAELGEGNDIYGESVFKKIRTENEAKLLAEDERKRKEWLEGEVKDQEKVRRQLKDKQLQRYNEAAVVEARPRADPKERPFLAWVQKHHLRATDVDVDVLKMTTFRRLLPTLAMTIFIISLCYLFARTYRPPARENRVWPDVPPAAATVIGIMGANLAIFSLWRLWPPAWRMLNRYFISVPLYPSALSVVGSVFSHQQFKHLAVNMVILWSVGVRLHEDIGRGNFLAIYLTSGAIGSMVSLTAHVLTNKLTVTSLGASGAICGIVAAWCVIHANDKLTLFFLPSEWQEKFSALGSVLLAVIIAFETFCLFSRFRVPSLDYWAHLGGYFAGAAWAATAHATSPPTAPYPSIYSRFASSLPSFSSGNEKSR